MPPSADHDNSLEGSSTVILDQLVKVLPKNSQLGNSSNYWVRDNATQRPGPKEENDETYPGIKTPAYAYGDVDRNKQRR